MMRGNIGILLAMVVLYVPTATAELPGIIDPLPKGSSARICFADVGSPKPRSSDWIPDSRSFNKATRFSAFSCRIRNARTASASSSF